jgi:Ala-tRNA(Pro) deacylase
MPVAAPGRTIGATSKEDIVSVHNAPKSLLDELDQAGIEYELIPHPRTESAAAEAEALGVAPREVAKTLVLTTPDGFVLAVLPASERLDLAKVREFLKDDQAALATEELLAGAYPEFELGAVPPFVHGDRVLVDVRVCENLTVLLEAGTHEQSLSLKTRDLVSLSNALLADICRD